MTTVDQFLKALAVVESADNPEAWGDAGRAMGRWQVHPDRLWQELHANQLKPAIGCTWDQIVCLVLRAIWAKYFHDYEPVEIAMYWHLGHFTEVTSGDWDGKYDVRFMAALANAIMEMP